MAAVARLIGVEPEVLSAVPCPVLLSELAPTLDQPLLLQTTLQHAKEEHTQLSNFDIHACLLTAQLVVERCKKQHYAMGSLNHEEAMALNVITQENVFCRKLDEALCSKLPSNLSPFIPFLQLVHQAAQHCGLTERVVHCGSRTNLKPVLQEGSSVCWSGIVYGIGTSKPLMGEGFLGATGDRSLVTLTVKSAVDITGLSCIVMPGQSQYLVLPMVSFFVRKCAILASGITVVQLEQKQEAQVDD
eukprot:m.60898 g.60898  ORF g.60898 m.60898 type:complete len:245 (+) comp11839_c1_seq1:162-896(+)